MEPFDTGNIKPGSIKILGNKIKQRRKKFNLSQAELAKDICTQGLISRIENKNVSVTVDIIYSLCHRLDLNINEVIVHHKTKNKTLDLVESLIWDKRYEDATELMAQLNVNKLDTRELKRRYHCYQGVIESRLNHNAQAAVNHFKEVLLKYSSLNQISLYTTWSHIEIAKSYLMLKDLHQAQQFNELSMVYLKQHRLNDQVDFRPLVNVYLELIHLNQQLMQFEDALTMIESVCSFLLSIDSMYQMGTLNLAMAKCFIADKSHAKAINHLERAHHFGDYYNDHQLVTTVNELREQMLAK